MSGLGLVLAGLGWTLFFGLAWGLARAEKLESAREKYVVRPGLVVLPGGQRVPRAEWVELRLSLSQRRNSLCLVGGQPYSLCGGEELGRWLSQLLCIPLLVSSEPEPKQFSCPAAYPRGIPPACFNPTPLLFGAATAGALCAVGSDPRNLSYWFALAMLGAILHQILQEGEDDYRIILLYRHRVPTSDTFLSGWALARNCTRLDALAGRAGVKSLSQDGFPDPLRDQKVVWRPASDGLVTVEALIRAAQDQDTPFSWLIEHGSVTSALVWERRGGHP